MALGERFLVGRGARLGALGQRGAYGKPVVVNGVQAVRGLMQFPYLPGVAPRTVRGRQLSELLFGDIYQFVGMVVHATEGGQGVGVALLLTPAVGILVVGLKCLGVGMACGVMVPGTEDLAAVTQVVGELAQVEPVLLAPGFE
ncbi:hypothetical protein ACN6LM_002602 [Streptomyces sp. SAS_281]|uniref:hypothetical protein n=1 Tax=Streptomyces sp. SAS_281 TaxID=3412744 RepID=UPI00403C770C